MNFESARIKENQTRKKENQTRNDEAAESLLKNLETKFQGNAKLLIENLGLSHFIPDQGAYNEFPKRGEK